MAYLKVDAMINKADSSRTLARSYQIPKPPGRSHRAGGNTQSAPAQHAQTAHTMYSQLNTEQKHAFDSIKHSQEFSTGEGFFIDGPGGTGKSFTYLALIAALKAEGLKPVVVASTGIAATLLEGVTAHKKFSMPLLINHDSVSFMKAQSREASELRTCDLIIWDEATASHRHALELLDRLLKDLCKSTELFGGKTVVLGGDFRQTLPIVHRGSSSQQVAASIRMSPVWGHFKTIALTQNLRAKDCPDWAEWLLKVGDGLLGESLSLDPRIHTVHRFQDLIDSTFGTLLDLDTLPLLRKRVILCPTNAGSTIINNHILKSIEGPDDFTQSIDTAIFHKKKEDIKVHLPESSCAP